MITLALDTSTDCGSVALLCEDMVLHQIRYQRQIDEGLFPALEELLVRHGDRPVERIAVGLGPGSFTGIRAGLAAAKGLALPRNLPIHGTSSFDALAWGHREQQPADCELICVLADARRGEVCYRLYDRAGQPQGPHQLGQLENIADAVHDPIWFVSAEIERYAAAIKEIFGGFAVVAPAPLHPSAAAVGKLATAGSLEPIYLRPTQFRQL